MEVVWKRGSSLTQDSIDELARIWDVQLPNEFKSVIMKNNSGRPYPYTFDTNSSQCRVFSKLQNFDLRQDVNVVKHYLRNQERLPTKLFPFAYDAAGNYICFDYRSGQLNPKIVLFNHEGVIIDEKEIYEIEFVASSFAEFLSQLY